MRGYVEAEKKDNGEGLRERKVGLWIVEVVMRHGAVTCSAVEAGLLLFASAPLVCGLCVLGFHALNT